MSLSYDFDMFSIIPDDVQQGFQAMFNELRVSSQMSQQVALFRDPKVPQALKTADEQIKQLFLNSGFGLNIYSSGAPANRFPAMDENARNACMSRFARNLKALENPKSLNWGGFEPLPFIDYFEQAEAMDEADIDAYREAQMKVSQRLAARRKLATAGLATGGVLMSVAAFGVLF